MLQAVFDDLYSRWLRRSARSKAMDEAARQLLVGIMRSALTGVTVT